MKTFLKIAIVCVLIIACKDQKNEPESLKSVIEKEKPTQKNEKIDSKAVVLLTKEQYELFFPKQLGDYNLIQVGEDKVQGIGTGTYIKGKDYGNVMHYFVTDGHRKGSSALRNFKKSYESDEKAPEGREYVRKERDGYKTFALLEHKYNMYDVSAIYNNRFQLTVKGHEKPDELWTYLKQANLEILD